jgi:hypothetical protein
MPVRNAKTAKTTWLETISVKDFEAALETNRLTFIRGYKLKGASIQGVASGGISGSANRCG